MLPWVVISALGASVLTASTVKMVNVIKSRKQTKENEIEAIKSELIEKINEYDSKHIEEEGEKR